MASRRRGRSDRPVKSLFYRAFVRDGKPKFYHTGGPFSNPKNGRRRMWRKCNVPEGAVAKIPTLCCGTGGPLCMMWRAVLGESLLRKANGKTTIQILLGAPYMKISSLGKLTLGAAMFAVAAGPAFANVTPNLTDSQGAALKDASGACVATSGVVHPDCAGVKPAAPAKPAEPPKPAAPTAPSGTD